MAGSCGTPRRWRWGAGDDPMGRYGHPWPPRRRGHPPTPARHRPGGRDVSPDDGTARLPGDRVAVARGESERRASRSYEESSGRLVRLPGRPHRIALRPLTVMHCCPAWRARGRRSWPCHWMATGDLNTDQSAPSSLEWVAVGASLASPSAYPGFACSGAVGDGERRALYGFHHFVATQLAAMPPTATIRSPARRKQRGGWRTGGAGGARMGRWRRESGPLTPVGGRTHVLGWGGGLERRSRASW